MAEQIEVVALANKTAEEIVSQIAPNEADYQLAPGSFYGYVQKVKKASIDFVWIKAGKPEEMTVNKHAVVCSRTALKGRTWYGYTLDPFGADVSYRVACEVPRLMLSTFGVTKQRKVESNENES